MELVLDINNRLYDDIKKMCDINNISVDEYILGTISDSFYIMKYGDLNDKLSKNNLKTIVVEEVEEKKKTTPKKKNETKESNIVDNIESVDTKIIEDVDKDTNKVKITRKRTLKAK